MTIEEFKIGDCVNLNHVEQPCGKLVAVVVGIVGDCLLCQYLNAEEELDQYNEPPMRSPKEGTTKLSEFGVVIKGDGSDYWCEQETESKAKYADGQPREWQDHFPEVRRGRPKLMQLVFAG